jgi:hypothetical protein
MQKACVTEQHPSVKDIARRNLVVYAGFWLRVAAVLVDCVAMFIPFCIIAFIVILMTRLGQRGKRLRPRGNDSSGLACGDNPRRLVLLCRAAKLSLAGHAWEEGRRTVRV